MTDPISNSEVIQSLILRANHLEDLLVSSLLGFFLTATAIAFAGVHALRAGPTHSIRLTPRQCFVGLAFMYGLLSGYYYFMLGQFYGAVIPIIAIARKSANASLSTLWAILRVPSFGILSPGLSNTLMLVNAPL